MRHDKGMLIPVRIGLIGWGGKTFGAKVGKGGSNKSVTKHAMAVFNKPWIQVVSSRCKVQQDLVLVYQLKQWRKIIRLELVARISVINTEKCDSSGSETIASYSGRVPMWVIIDDRAVLRP